MKKVFHIITTCIVFLLNISLALAQPGGGGDPLPCDPDDPTCPLDTWVIVLVIIAAVFAAAHLYRQKKSLQA